MPQPHPDRTSQIADVRALALELVDTLQAGGYAPEIVAEGLLEGALSAVADDRGAFLTALGLFRRANAF